MMRIPRFLASHALKSNAEHIAFLKSTNLSQYMQATKNSYYSILNVAPNAQPDDIKRSYQVLMKNLHPDVNNSVEVVSKENFDAIQVAYKNVSVAEKRSLYDEEQSKAVYFWILAAVLMSGAFARYVMLPVFRRNTRRQFEFSDIWHEK